MITQNRPLRVLVIQLGKLSDTIQSLMALRAASQLYPNLEVHVVVREHFADAVLNTPWIKNVTILPTFDMIEPSLKSKAETGDYTSEGKKKSLSRLARWISPLVREKWDLAINWSFSDPSSFIMGLVPSQVKLGFSRRKDGTLLVPDGWSHYFQALVQGGIDQDIHITDILTTQLLTALQIHLGDPKTDGEQSVTSKSFFTTHATATNVNSAPGEKISTSVIRDFSKKWVAVQLGPKSGPNSWKVIHVAELCSKIMTQTNDTGVILLGAPEMTEEAEAIITSLKSSITNGALNSRDSNRVINRVGQSSFTEWASLIAQCQWMISTDSAAVSLASVLGTRVFMLSLGTSRFLETGPYGNAHYVVSAKKSCGGCLTGSTDPTLHQCSDHISGSSAFTAWLYASTEWSHRRNVSISEFFESRGELDSLSTIQVFRSKIRDTEAGGGVSYERLNFQSFTLSDWMASTLGYIARYWYCGWTPKIGADMTLDQLNGLLFKDLRGLEESVQVLSRVIGQCRQTSVQLYLKSSGLKSEAIMSLSNRNELQEHGKKLIELEKLIERIVQTQPQLNVFSRLLKVLMHNLRGNQISELGKESANAYQQIQAGIEQLQLWITHTLELAKPKSVSPSNGKVIEFRPRAKKEIST